MISNTDIPPLVTIQIHCKSGVPEIKGPEGAHDPEVAGQGVLAEVVVGQVQHLDTREGAEAAGKVVQLVDALKQEDCS